MRADRRRSAHVDAVGGEVDVAPAQRAQLALAHAGLSGG
jgi:hypothetical protein